MAAIEYEVRIWDEHGDPLSSGISYSLNEVGRYDRFVDTLVDALHRLGVELSAVHTEAGPGLLELNLAPGRGLAAADGATLVKFAAKQVAATMDLPGELPRQDRARRGGVERTRPPLLLGRRHERVRRRRPARRAPGSVRRGHRRRRRAPPRPLAAVEPHDQLLQAARPGLVRADQRHVGLREPFVRRPRDPLRSTRSCGGSSAGVRARTPTRTSRSPRSPRAPPTGSGATRRRRIRSRATPTRSTCRSYPGRSRARSGPSTRTTSCGRPSATRSATTTRRPAGGS